MVDEERVQRIEEVVSSLKEVPSDAFEVDDEQEDDAEEEEQDVEVCQATTSDGETCGRELPCRYHSKEEQ